MGANVPRKVPALSPTVKVSGSQACIDPRRRRGDAGCTACSHVELTSFLQATSVAFQVSAPWRQSWLPTDEKHRFREFRENHDTELLYFTHPFNHLRMALGLLWQPCSFKTKGKPYVTHLLIVEIKPSGNRVREPQIDW
jgi:hypothetical protein